MEWIIRNVLVLALATSCTASLRPEAKDGGKVTASTAAPETSAATSTETTEPETTVIRIPAADLGQLKVVTIDQGPLSGTSVQATGDPNGDVIVSFAKQDDFPLTVDGDAPLVVKLRIQLPDSMTAGLDFTHPETIDVYARGVDGKIYKVDAADVLAAAPHVFVTIGQYQSLAVVQGKAPLAFTTPGVVQISGAPEVAWTSSPVGKTPTYTLDVYGADCTTLVQSQAITTTSIVVAPPLAPGSYCAKISAKVGSSTYASTAAPLLITVNPPSGGGPATPFAINGTSGLTSAVSNPTITWGNAPRVADATVTYEAKFCADANCVTVEASQSNLTVATYSASPALPEGTHYVVVTAKNGADATWNATGSGTFTIKTDSIPPSTFIITGPSNPTSATPPITWSASSDASSFSYDFFLYRSDCTTLAESAPGASSSPHNVISPLLASTTYCVKVFAKDALGNTRPATNNGFTFMTNIAKPSPATGAGNTPSSNAMILTWAASPQGVGYLVVRHTGAAVDWVPTDGVIYGSGAANGTNTVVGSPTGTTLTDTGLASGTNYHYAIYAFNASYAYAATATITNGTTTGSPSSNGNGYIGVLGSGTVNVLQLHDGAFTFTTSFSLTSANAAGIALDKDDYIHLMDADVSSSSIRSEDNRIGVFGGFYNNRSCSPSLVAFAVDSTDKHHAVYSDLYDFYYAKGTTYGAWAAPELIRASPDATLSLASIDIALDRNDVPRVIFVQNNASGVNPRIFYGSRASGSWVLSALNDLNKNAGALQCSTPANEPVFALDDTGSAHVAYVCDGNAIYATNRSGNWTYSQIGIQAHVMAIAVTGSGTPWVALSQGASGMTIQSFNGTSWAPSTLSTSARVAQPRVTIDPLGFIHAYWFENASLLKHASNVSGSFQVDATYSTSAAAFIKGSGHEGMRGNGNRALYNPNLVFGYNRNGNSTIVMTKSAGSWADSFTGSGSTDGSVAIGPDGATQVAWYSFGDGAFLYANSNTASWTGTPVTIDTSGTATMALAVDANSQARLAFSSSGVVLARRQTAGVFGSANLIRTPGTTAPADSVDLALDGSGKEHFVYNDPDGASVTPIYYSENTSGSFTTTAATTLNKISGSTACATQSSNPRIAVTRAGKAYITYYCDGYIILATNVSGSWTYTSVLLTGLDTEANITLDADEVPYVATRTAAGAIGVKYGPTLSSGWAVAPTSRTVDAIVAVDALKTIHVIYVTTPGHTVRHATRTVDGTTNDESVHADTLVTKLFRTIAIPGLHGQGQ